MPMTSDLRQTAPIIGELDDNVAVIDANRLLTATGDERRKIVSSVRSACLQTGFFYLENVFSGTSALQNVLSQMQDFFALPDDDQRKQSINNQHKPGSYGWMPLFGEPAYQPGTVAHLESFDCGLEQAATDKNLEGQNAWPDMDGFRDAALEYWGHISATGDAVLGAISEAAGLSPQFLPEACRSQQLNTMRLLNYPANDAPSSDSAVGIAAHTDFECITLILQTQPGLELTDINGNWYDAPGHDGRVVVLLDDMLERWTNGTFKATGHRVRNTHWQRFSVVMFFAVDDHVTIEPLPQFVNAGNPARFTPVRQRDHIDQEILRAEKNRKSPG